MSPDDRVGLREALGLLPLRERLRQAAIALRGAPHVPPSRWDRSSLALVRPSLGLPLWRGEWVVPAAVAALGPVAGAWQRGGLRGEPAARPSHRTAH